MENIDESLPFISIECDKNYIYIIAYWIAEIVMILCQSIFADNFQLSEGYIEDEFINLFCIIIADLFAGFCVLFTVCSSKKKKDKKQLRKKKSKHEIELIHRNLIKEKHSKKIGTLLCISIMHLISISTYFVFYLLIKFKDTESSEILPKYQIDWVIGIDFFIRHALSRIILRTRLYKHHGLSLINLGIGFLGMTILDIIYMFLGKIDIKTIVYIFLMILRVFFFSLSDVIIKILLTDDFFLPQHLMFYRGFIEFIIILVISFVLYYTSKIKFYFIETGIIYRLLMKFGFTIIVSLKSFFLLKVIDKFTAQYVSFLVFGECLGNNLYHFYGCANSDNSCVNKNQDIKVYIIDIISMFIILFSSLIYTEIIIINICGLNKNTRKALSLIGNKEVKEASMKDATDEDEDKSEDEKSNILLIRSSELKEIDDEINKTSY
jgi:hypothetical protein